MLSNTNKHIRIISFLLKGAPTLHNFAYRMSKDTAFSCMQKCMGFTDDNQMLINITSSCLCKVKVCAMIQCQAVNHL